MKNIDAAKLAWRDQILAARRGLSLGERQERNAARTGILLAAPEVRRAAVVAAYVSVGREPGTGLLLRALADAGKRVLLPRLQPDNDLDWTVYTGDDDLRTAARGLLEPSGPSLGVEAIVTADVVLVPGLAADQHGHRLGRGGGSYDRALQRCAPEAWRCLLLHEGELLDAVPVEEHDQSVHAAVTEAALYRF